MQQGYLRFLGTVENSLARRLLKQQKKPRPCVKSQGKTTHLTDADQAKDCASSR